MPDPDYIESQRIALDPIIFPCYPKAKAVSTPVIKKRCYGIMQAVRGYMTLAREAQQVVERI